MPIGYIIANIYTSRARLPVQGALISVTFLSNDGVDLIGHRESDAQGATDAVVIEAPPRELSEHPSQKQPFSVCDIRVDHPMYYPVVVKNAQIFADTTSLQEVELVPLIENPGPNIEPEVVIVEPQDL